MYRHFFSQDHHPEKYTMDEIKGQIGEGEGEGGEGEGQEGRER